MKNTILVLVSLMSLNVFADDCSNLYNEAVSVEQGCANVVANIQAQRKGAMQFIEIYDRIGITNDREQKVYNDLVAKVNDLDKNGQKYVNDACNKRWDVMAVNVSACKTTMACEANAAGQYELKLYNAAKTASHVMHTYGSQYECIGRKSKVTTAAAAQ